MMANIHARWHLQWFSESSFFVSPHRLILKTCGTTLNLLGLPRILEIARDYASLPSVYQCFYSRKAFMFPERQQGPHRDWRAEVEYLDEIFHNGAAYTIGKVNGDHWLLYITSPGDHASTSSSPLIVPGPLADTEAPSTTRSGGKLVTQDYTIEILMCSIPYIRNICHWLFLVIQCFCLNCIMLFGKYECK